MKAVCYFNNVECLKDPDLLELWKKSWAKYGWEPVVLTYADAVKTDENMVNRFRASPLLKSHPGNPPDYVWACLVRWVAQLSIQEPCIHVDWDIICNGYRPSDFPKESNDFRPVFMAGSLCPCAIAGWPKTWQMICAWLECAPFAPNFDPEMLRKDNSDQYALGYVMPKNWAKIEHHCLFYREDKNWKTAPLIHFPTRLTGYPRSKIIQKELSL